MVQPGGAAGEAGMDPVPGGSGHPVPGGHRAGGDRRVRPGGRVGQGQLAAVLAGPAVCPGPARRPSAARGKASPASDRRSRPISIRPWFTASYGAPWPRRCSGAGDSPARSLSGQSAHSTASASSDSSSARAVRQAWKSTRNRDSTARDSTSAACSSKLSITAFAAIMGSLASTHDHADAVLTRRDTPDKSVKPLIRKLRG